MIDDSENKRKLFVKGKNNLSPANLKSLAYGFNARPVGTDKRTGKDIIAPHIEWFPEHVDVTGNEAMQAASTSKAPGARDSAKKFLEDILADGPVLKTEIEDAAEANGVSERTLSCQG